jgi:hypothetical protein
MISYAEEFVPVAAAWGSQDPSRLSYLESGKDVHQYRYEAPEQPVDQCNLVLSQ